MCQLALLATAAALNVSAQTPTGDDLLARMAAHQLADNKVLKRYTGTRLYTLHNSRFQVNASILVRVDFRSDAGKSFSIISHTGSLRIRQRVFEPLLKTETEESRPDHRAASALSTANYRSQLIGREPVDGRDCWVLAVEPLRRSRFLLSGKLWVDWYETQPVRFQGRPASSVSFWVGQPLITETLQKWNGFWLPVRNTSFSSGFLLGTSELTIDYLTYDIDVTAPKLKP